MIKKEVQFKKCLKCKKIIRGNSKTGLCSNCQKHPSWIFKQRKMATKVFAPKVSYDKENDILYIVWFPETTCESSLETQNGFVFDITKNDYVKGIEIFDFKQRFMK